MLFLFFLQLIPSRSSLPRATWLIHPSLYHSFPSAAELLHLRFAASQLWRYEEKKNIHWDILSLICSVWESNPLNSDLFSIKSDSSLWDSCAKLSSFKDIRLWKLEKSPASTPTWEFFLFYFVLYFVMQGRRPLLFYFSSFWWDIKHCNRSGLFSFRLPTHTRYFNYVAAIWAPKKRRRRKSECCSSVTVKPQHFFFLYWLYWWAHLQLYCCLLLCCCQKMETLIYSEQNF